MKELFDIARRYDELARSGAPAALATVIRAAGSTYRLPGARMLIDAGGSVTGCVSGGCLERDVVEQAQRVLASGEPRIVVYDTREDDEGDWSFGLGCKGRVDVLIEALRDEPANPVRFVESCLHTRREGAIATVVGVERAGDVRVGQRVLANADGVAAASIADASVAERCGGDLRSVLASGSMEATYAVSAGGVDGRVEVVLERVRRPLQLVLFGCGHDATPLARFAGELGWPVTVVDYRPRNLARARGLGGVTVVAARPGEFAGAVAFDDRTAAVVMNHNYADDRAVLETLLAAPLGYVGLLGPRARTAQLMADVRPASASRALSPGCIHGPVGLDIGAANPEEIAVSIVAEILAVFAGREGGHASNRVAPLHTREGAVEGVPSGSVSGTSACGIAHG